MAQTRKPRVAIQVRMPPKLHARLVKAAKREGHSLNDEILLRVSVPATAVVDLLDRLELDFRDMLLEAADTCKAVADEAIRGAFVKMLHKIENGDLPMLLNERLAKTNSDIIRDVVNEAISMRLEGHQDEETEGAAAQNGPALPER
jgi:uncharacterized protein (DUF1778 family)